MNKYYVLFLDDRVNDVKVFDSSQKEEMKEFVKEIKLKELTQGSSYGIEKVIYGQEMTIDFKLESIVDLSLE